MKSKKEFRIHFVGIGGIGMSGIAEVLFNQGYPVSGSDWVASETTERLEKSGIKIRIGHARENVEQVDVVVISSAVKRDNPEVAAALDLGLPIIPRAEMLAELMRGKTGLAIAGTHGKTTTTSMVAQMLSDAGMDPTLIIGGRVNALGGNAKLGGGEFLVAEADESDGSFLHLSPTLAVITNIDSDHLDHFGSLQALDEAFIDFASKVPFYGKVFVCGDDPGARRVLPRIRKPMLTYGLHEGNAIQAVDLSRNERFTEFTLSREGREQGRVRLKIPGLHNVRNALGALAIALEAGVPFQSAVRTLESFQGARRRFDVRYRDESNRIALVDDYGHHPTEIKATLEAARVFWSGRILVLFQPHRYSRTLLCMKEFERCFQGADGVWITDVYAAGEDPIAGATAQALVEHVKGSADQPQAVYGGSLMESEQALARTVRPGDLVLTLGAGSVSQSPERLIQSLKSRKFAG